MTAELRNATQTEAGEGMRKIGGGGRQHTREERRWICLGLEYVLGLESLVQAARHETWTECFGWAGLKQEATVAHSG